MTGIQYDLNSPLKRSLHLLMQLSNMLLKQIIIIAINILDIAFILFSSIDMLMYIARRQIIISSFISRYFVQKIAQIFKIKDNYKYLAYNILSFFTSITVRIIQSELIYLFIISPLYIAFATTALPISLVNILHIFIDFNHALVHYDALVMQIKETKFIEFFSTSTSFKRLISEYFTYDTTNISDLRANFMGLLNVNLYIKLAHKNISNYFVGLATNIDPAVYDRKNRFILNIAATLNENLYYFSSKIVDYFRQGEEQKFAELVKKFQTKLTPSNCVAIVEYVKQTIISSKPEDLSGKISSWIYILKKHDVTIPILLAGQNEELLQTLELINRYRIFSAGSKFCNSETIRQLFSYEEILKPDRVKIANVVFEHLKIDIPSNVTLNELISDASDTHDGKKLSAYMYKHNISYGDNFPALNSQFLNDSSTITDNNHVDPSDDKSIKEYLYDDLLCEYLDCAVSFWMNNQLKSNALKSLCKCNFHPFSREELLPERIFFDKATYQQCVDFVCKWRECFESLSEQNIDILFNLLYSTFNKPCDYTTIFHEKLRESKFVYPWLSRMEDTLNKIHYNEDGLFANWHEEEIEEFSINNSEFRCALSRGVMRVPVYLIIQEEKVYFDLPALLQHFHRNDNCKIYDIEIESMQDIVFDRELFHKIRSSIEQEKPKRLKIYDNSRHVINALGTISLEVAGNLYKAFNPDTIPDANTIEDSRHRPRLQQ